MAAWRYEIFPLVLKNISPVNVLKNISLVRCAHSNTTLEGKFRISARPCNILYLSYLFTLFDVILFQSISSNHVM